MCFQLCSHVDCFPFLVLHQSNSNPSPPLLNCIIKPFSYSSQSVSEPPPSHCLSPLPLLQINETAQSLPLSMTLNTELYPPAELPPSLSALLNTPPLQICLSAPVFVAVSPPDNPVGQLVSFHNALLVLCGCFLNVRQGARKQ